MFSVTNTRGLAALACALFLTGCTTTVTVTSDPEGAMITNRAGTVKYGYAPVEVNFDKDVLEQSIDPTDPMRCAKVQGFTARWPSGAEAHSENPLPVCDLRYGETVALKRPQGVEGEEIDLRWALERAQRRAVEAEMEKKRLENYLNTPMFLFWRPY